MRFPPLPESGCLRLGDQLGEENVAMDAEREPASPESGSVHRERSNPRPRSGARPVIATRLTVMPELGDISGCSIRVADRREVAGDSESSG